MCLRALAFQLLPTYPNQRWTLFVSSIRSTTSRPGGAFTVLGVGVAIQSLGTLGTALLQYLNDSQAPQFREWVFKVNLWKMARQQDCNESVATFENRCFMFFLIYSTSLSTIHPVLLYYIILGIYWAPRQIWESQQRLEVYCLRMLCISVLRRGVFVQRRYVRPLNSQRS